MKKSFLVLSLVVLVAGGLILLSSVTRAAQEASQPQPYTAKFFGPWNAAVANTHVPQVTYEKMGKALMVTVKVDNHPMDPKKPHWIMWIRVEDVNGKVLAKKEFKATDPAPVAIFHLASWPEKLKVFERCNIHGIWLNEVDVKLK
jgi:superoxide reductase